VHIEATSLHHFTQSQDLLCQPTKDFLVFTTDIWIIDTTCFGRHDRQQYQQQKPQSALWTDLVLWLIWRYSCILHRVTVNIISNWTFHSGIYTSAYPNTLNQDFCKKNLAILFIHTYSLLHLHPSLKWHQKYWAMVFSLQVQMPPTQDPLI